MADTSVNIQIKTSGQQKLDQLYKSFQKTDDKLKGLTSTLNTKLQSSLRNAGTAAQGFGRQFKAVMLKAEQQVARFQRKTKGLGGALASAGAGLALGRSVSGGADLVQTQIRIKALSEEYGEFDRIQKLVTKNAETFNQSQREATNNFADAYARLRPLGVELEQIQTVYEGFNAVALASGTSAQAASGAFLQLSQALGSGRLQGDEFRSIAEQVPGILKLVADEMGVTVGALKKLGSDGKITADVLINSLAKGFELNKDKIQQIINQSPAQKFKAFGDSVSDLSDAMGTELLPVITPAVDGLTGMVGVFGRLPGPIKTVTALMFGLAGGITAVSGALNLFGVSLTKSGMLKFLALGGKIALVAAPLVAVAVAMEDAAKSKKKLDDALASNSLNEVEDELKRATTAQKQLKSAFESTKDAPYYKGQIADVKRLEDELTEATTQVEELTRRRQLIIDLKINVPFPNFDKMGSGFSDELAKELAELGYAYTPGEEVKPLKKKGGGGGSGTGISGSNEMARFYEEQQQNLKASEELLGNAQGQLALLNSRNELERINTQFTIDSSNALMKYQELMEGNNDEQTKLNLLKARSLELDSLAIQRSKDLKSIFEDQAQSEFNDFFKQQPEYAGLFNDELTETEKLLQSSYNIVSGSLQSGIEGLIKGTQSWSDVLSDIAGQLGSMFLQAGFSALGGALKIPGFADGGRPPMGQVSVVGERGPELFVPDTAGTVISNERSVAALNTYNAGNTTAVAAPPPTPTFKLETQVINGVEYATVDQVREMGVIATRNGAKQGQARTMNTLKNSRSQRSKLGM